VDLRRSPPETAVPRNATSPSGKKNIIHLMDFPAMLVHSAAAGSEWSVFVKIFKLGAMAEGC